MNFQEKSRRYWGRALLAMLGLVSVGLVFYLGLRTKLSVAPNAEPDAPGLSQACAGRPMTDPFRNLVFPTGRSLDRHDASLFQPTASDRPESALFGSVRIANYGKGLAASFHEGVDIAAGQRDAAGRPLDAVYAVADGTVGYVNTVAGNSNYGKYVVLTHACPSGIVYSLYAHLATILPGVIRNRPVKAGDRLGIVGHTANPPIPLSRAHLHFEIGLILNAQFSQWCRAQKTRNEHGMFNGWNLFGIEPLAVWAGQRPNPGFDFFQNIAALPVAFEIVLSTRRQPDFFNRYPCLWEGGEYQGAGLKMAVSENGLPIKGRNATELERQLIGKKKSAVLRVDPAVLGRNGCHLIVCRNGLWRLGPEGEKWRDILIY